MIYLDFFILIYLSFFPIQTRHPKWILKWGTRLKYFYAILKSTDKFTSSMMYLNSMKKNMVIMIIKRVRSIEKLIVNNSNLARLPYSIRVILEAAVRNCDELQVTSRDVKNLLNWPDTQKNEVEVPFIPSRVLLQDFT